MGGFLGGFTSTPMTSSLDLNVIQLAKDELSPKNVRQFMMSYESRKKSVGPAVALALLLGGIGAHKFYLGDTVGGVIYLVIGTVGWFLVVPPLILAVICIIDACMMNNTVGQYNRTEAKQLIAELQLLED